MDWTLILTLVVCLVLLVPITRMLVGGKKGEK